MSWWPFGTKSELPTTVKNVNNTIVPTQTPATELQVTGGPAANVAAQGAIARGPITVTVKERRGDYVALGGRRKSKKTKKSKSKKSKSKSRK